MKRLGLTLFGDFQARLGSGPSLRLRTRKAQALLWGERSQHQARGRLRETLFALRRALAGADPPCLDLTGDAVALKGDAVDVDVAAFERLVQAGGPEALEQAIGLYRGDFLEGLAFRGARFEEWLMAERERLRERAVEALAAMLATQRTAGGVDLALQTGLRLIALDPLQESVPGPARQICRSRRLRKPRRSGSPHHHGTRSRPAMPTALRRFVACPKANRHTGIRSDEATQAPNVTLPLRTSPCVTRSSCTSERAGGGR